jgi:hypothetical protein
MMSYITCNHPDDDISIHPVARPGSRKPPAVVPFVSPEQETNAPRIPIKMIKLLLIDSLASAAKRNPQPAQF